MDDDALVATWLHGRSASTRRAYGRQLSALRAGCVNQTLAIVNLTDLQRHVDGLAHLAPRSQALAVSAIKSFYAFHARCGSIPLNPAAGLVDIRVPQDLAERILEEGDISKLVSAAGEGRDRAALELLYGAGLRAAELCTLYWRQLAPRADNQGQVTVTGKGGKTRAILLPPALWQRLVDLKVNFAPSDPVFPSDRDPKRPIGQRQLLRIVKRAAAAAGLSEKVSNHWLRHSHVSHALDHGAPIQLVRDTVGHASIATTNRYAHARPNASSASYLSKKGE